MLFGLLLHILSLPFQGRSRSLPRSRLLGGIYQSAGLTGEICAPVSIAAVALSIQPTGGKPMPIFAPNRFVIRNLLEYMFVMRVKSILIGAQSNRMYIVAIYGLTDEELAEGLLVANRGALGIRIGIGARRIWFIRRC